MKVKKFLVDFMSMFVLILGMVLAVMTLPILWIGGLSGMVDMLMVFIIPFATLFGLLYAFTEVEDENFL